MLVTETAEDAGCKARLAQVAGGALILDASAAPACEVSADWAASIFKRWCFEGGRRRLPNVCDLVFRPLSRVLQLTCRYFMF